MLKRKGSGLCGFDHSETAGTERTESAPKPSRGTVMTPVRIIICTIGVVLVASGCAIESKKTAEKIQTMPINCATADGELRVLDSEKKTTMQRIGAGVASVVPIGLVVGLVTTTAGTKYRIATGQYNTMIDNKIAEIKQTCPGSTPDIE
jgi:hypothetical protein